MGIFNKKDKKEDTKEKIMDDELTLEELDKVTAGVPVSGGIMSDISTQVNYEPTEDELTEAELDEVTAGVPVIDSEEEPSI